MATTSINLIDDILSITKQDATSTICNKLSDEIIPKIEDITRITNEINWKFNEEIKPSIKNNKDNIEEIKPSIKNNKDNIEEINNLLKNEILPVTTDFIELYEIIIIRILLSKFVMFLNRIFKWYSYTIQEIDDDSIEIPYIISLSETNIKNIHNVRHKIFKNKLKELKKEYKISYNDLVNITILYTKNILRK